MRGTERAQLRRVYHGVQPVQPGPRLHTQAIPSRPQIAHSSPSTRQQARVIFIRPEPNKSRDILISINPKLESSRNCWIWDISNRHLGTHFRQAFSRLGKSRNHDLPKCVSK